MSLASSCTLQLKLNLINYKSIHINISMNRRKLLTLSFLLALKILNISIKQCNLQFNFSNFIYKITWLKLVAFATFLFFLDTNRFAYQFRKLTIIIFALALIRWNIIRYIILNILNVWVKILFSYKFNWLCLFYRF